MVNPCYDWEQCGVYAAESAIEAGASRIIMIEGKLGQGAAGDQTKGFIQGYINAGKDVGDALENVGSKGGADLRLVYWGSGGWFADSGKLEMRDAIAMLGPDGFDGVYVQNDEMMDGAIQAMLEAGLNPASYWLGASNGKEKSWKWVQDGTTTMDVNQTPSLEADLASQQIKAYFDGRPYKKFVFSGIIPFDNNNIDPDKLIPYEASAYFEKKAKGAFIYDLNDPYFKTHTGYK